MNCTVLTDTSCKTTLYLASRLEVLAMAPAPPRPHAILLPFPADGHIIPLMRLGKILWAKGFAITFVNTEGNHDRLLHTAKQSGISLAEDPSFKLVGLGGLSRDETTKLVGMKGVELMMACADNLRKPFEELVEGELSRGDPSSGTCIITDSCIYWSHEVADKFGLVLATFFTSNAIFDFVIQNLEEFANLGLIPTKNPSATIEIPIPADIHLMQSEFPALFLEEGLALDFASKCKVRATDWALVNTLEELEPKAIAAMRKRIPKYLPVGPVHAYDVCKQRLDNEKGLTFEDRSCMDWLDAQAPASVLYVSFGSLSVVSKAQLRNIATGVVCSKTPFLWVQRPTLTGQEEDPDWVFEGLNLEQGMAVKWAPQVDILHHPSVGGFLSHCGWNSTSESITAGVPLLCWPVLGDQIINCKFIVEDWKIGLDFRGASRDENGFVCAQDVMNGVLSLMEGEEGRLCRIRVGEIRDMGLTAIRPGGSSSNNLQLFADAISEN